MKQLITIASVLVLSVNMASCQDAGNSGTASSTAASAGTNKTISGDEFASAINAGGNIQLIDVRTPGEYAGGHIGNAANIDINSDDFAQKVGALDKSKPVYVYCLSGGRSASAASALQQMGFQEIYNLAGGVMKWKAEGKPLGNAVAATGNGMSMDDFSKATSESEYVLVDFHATWCAPCKKLAPIVDEVIRTSKTGVKLLKVDADENKAVVEAKRIDGIPLLELYHNGKLVWSHAGLIDKDDLMKEAGL